MSNSGCEFEGAPCDSSCPSTSIAELCDKGEIEKTSSDYLAEAVQFVEKMPIKNEANSGK